MGFHHNLISHPIIINLYSIILSTFILYILSIYIYNRLVLQDTIRRDRERLLVFLAPQILIKMSLANPNVLSVQEENGRLSDPPLVSSVKALK